MASKPDLEIDWPRQLSSDWRRLAERVCTPAEIQALKLASSGYSHWRMALALGISRGAVRSRLNSGTSKIRAYADPKKLERHELALIITNSSSRARAKARGNDYTHYDRGAIIRRDNGICHLCGKKPSPTDTTLDHLTPISRGGHDTPDNVAVCCRHCNSLRGNQDLPTTSRYYHQRPPHLTSIRRFVVSSQRAEPQQP